MPFSGPKQTMLSVQLNTSQVCWCFMLCAREMLLIVTVFNLIQHISIAELY